MKTDLKTKQHTKTEMLIEYLNNIKMGNCFLKVMLLTENATEKESHTPKKANFYMKVNLRIIYLMDKEPFTTQMVL